MIKLSDAIDDYMTTCYALSPRTRSIYREHLTRLLNATGDLPLDMITKKCLTEFMATLRQKNGKEYSPAYLHQIWRTLHTFFVYCVEEDWLIVNSMRRVRKPVLESGPKPRLSLDQIQELLDAVERTTLYKRNLAIILLMVDSGLRLNEVVGLEIGDVYLDDETVLVKSAKTHKRREVPISSTTIQSIEAYLGERQRFVSTDESLFLKREASPITKNAVQQVIKRLEKRLKFPLYAHLLRHTFANTYIRQGKAAQLQKIMGHSSIETTIRFYTDLELEDIKKEHKTASPMAQLFAQ